jgi:hypothetical protein
LRRCWRARCTRCWSSRTLLKEEETQAMLMSIASGSRRRPSWSASAPPSTTCRSRRTAWRRTSTR